MPVDQFGKRLLVAQPGEARNERGVRLSIRQRLDDQGRERKGDFARGDGPVRPARAARLHLYVYGQGESLQEIPEKSA